MSDEPTSPLQSWLFLVVGAFLVLQFAGLGAWQINRGLEKRALQHIYDDDGGFEPWHYGMDVQPNQRLKVSGHYDSKHQFILEKIIVNDRYGSYVITPLIVDDDAPVLLVNRGWVQKAGPGSNVIELDPPGEELTLRGYVGSLPRPAYDRGKPIHPTLEEMAATLGHDLQPFVLLLDKQEPHGLLRHWVANEFGPGKHFGYALQWFAMGAALSAILIWNYRKKQRLAR
jgi:surfeit locus 1 family protein